MKKLRIPILLLILAVLAGCASGARTSPADILATTAPVAEIAGALVNGTGLTVDTLIAESVSCLHDYSLSVRQMEAVQRSTLVLLSGCGLEEFMADALYGRDVIEIAGGVTVHETDGHDHDHDHDHEHEEDGHDHELDAHIWLDPDNLAIMTHNAAAALRERWPEHADTITQNEAAFCDQLAALKTYGQQELAALSCRELVTFHDGFSYFADAFDLTIAASMEIEAGSEPSAAELREIVTLVRERGIPAIFTEKNGTTDAAGIVSRETGAEIYTLDMGMETGALAAIRHNIDTIREALG